MARFNDPLDDLPLLNRSKPKVRQEHVPVTKTFKGALLKTVNRLGKAGRNRGMAANKSWHRGRGSSTVSVKSSGPSSRRVIVKARVVKAGDPVKTRKAIQQHLSYIQRDGVNQVGGKGKFYSAPGREVDPDKFLARAEDDPHQFRFIISPEDAAELSLSDFTQSLMDTLETDLGRQVDWLAVNHYNTDNPHTHVTIRGRDLAGEELRLDRAYLSHGFREQARALATRELGPRNEHEIASSLQKEVEQERWTTLDAQIAKVSHAKLLVMDGSRRVALDEPGSTVSSHLDPYVVGRLNHLVTMGLAQREGPREFTLLPEHQQSLRDLGERHDIIKTMHGALQGHTGKYRVFDAQRDGLAVEGTLRFKGLQDELHDRYYAIVDAVDGHAVFVKLPKYVETDSLHVHQIVRIHSVADPWLKPADRVIAKFASDHDGVYNPTDHAKSLANQGRYRNANFDPVDFAQAHERRAQRLVRAGLLQKTEAGFSVPPDLEEKLNALDREKPNPHTIRVNVLDQQRLDQQITTQGPTWLDSVNVDSAAHFGFGAEVRAAKENRLVYLRDELSLDTAASSLGQQLESLERQRLAPSVAEATDKLEKPLTPGLKTQGVLMDKLAAPSGKQYGVIVSARSFTLVPWRDRFGEARGQQVSFGMTESGIPFVKPLGQGLSK